MDIRKILADLRAERDRLDEAIAAVESLNSAGRRIGRRRQHPTRVQAASTKPRRRRRLSAAARKKLSALLKARWASGKMGKRKTRAA